MSATTPVKPPRPLFRSYRRRAEMREARRVFLDLIAQGRPRQEALAASALHGETVRRWCKVRPDFAAEYQAALAQGDQLRRLPSWAGDLLVLLALADLTVAEIAARLGVSRQRLYAARNEHALLDRAWTLLRPGRR